jgi:hypothetical protein
MPSKSEQQRKYIYYLRSQDEDKSKWFWDKDWEQIEETKMERYTPYFEDIIIPLSKGDTFLYGKFKNKQAIYASHYFNDKGDLIIVTDQKKEIPACKIRLVQEQLEENLRLSDLKKHAGISNFTKPFMKDRQRIKGTGARSAKIKSIKVNRKKDYITFTFTSEPTYTKTAFAVKFPDVEDKKKVRLYTQEIRILDFFKWAETKPGYIEKEMTPKEIKEILNVADVKLACNCFSFQFQGFNHILTTFDAAIYPELRPPKKWNKYHNDDSFTCKHLDLLISSGLNIYINNMTMMVNKYIKK